MNTSGYIRGYMAKNMSAEELINVVIKAISREFEEDVRLEKTSTSFEIRIKNYIVTISKDLIDEFKSPYGIDREILEQLEKQGFIFDRNRSQYIKYCFGNYIGSEQISL